MRGHHFLVLSILFLTIEETLQSPWWESSKAVSLDTTNFDQLVWKDKHYVVEFYSTMCYWCEVLAVDFNRLAENYMGENPSRGDVQIAKVNTPANNYLGYKFHIAQYPTILLMKKGQVNQALYYPHARSYDMIRQWIEKEIGPEEKIPEPEPVIVPPAPEPVPVAEPQTVPVPADIAPVPVAVPEPVAAPIDDEKDDFLSHADEPSKADSEVDRKIKALVQEPTNDDAGKFNATSLLECPQESLQMIYDQYTFALSQKTAYDGEFLVVKEKLNGLSGKSSASHLFRDLIFFSFGLAIGVGLFVTYKKVVSVGHLYTD